ncbi:MAG: C40 family peptidase, partial [Eggerthellaceae bacterium]|nr:C40 family peptidase [Eggerthellaceae bacterium]
RQEQAKNLVKQTQKSIDAQTEKIEELKGQLSTRVRSMYRAGASSFLDVLFGSTTFFTFANNWDLLSNMNTDDAMLVAQTKVERNKLDKLKEEQVQQQLEADEAAAEAQRIRDKANETAKRMQETYDALSAEAEELLIQRQLELAAAAAAAEQQAQAAAAQQAQVFYYDIESAAAADAGTAVAIDDITSFDADTGTATLSDGSTTKVVGYDINTGNAIVDLASKFVGGNYQWGAEDASTSTFDCSGLVQYVYAQNGITVGGHNSELILNAGNVVDSSQAQAGDILWWEGHVAIYAGDGMMISADNEEMGITYREVSDGATYVRY